MRIKEATCLYGTRFKDLILASFTEGKEFLHLSLMRLWFRQVAKIFGWIWLAIEPVRRSVLGIYISEERKNVVAEKFIRSLVDKYMVDIQSVH